MEIKSNCVDKFFDLIKDNEFIKIRSEIIIKNSKYFELNNTTDVSGWKTLLFTCCENININTEIYSMDILNSNFSEENHKKDSKENTLQMYLVEPTSRQTVIDFKLFISYIILHLNYFKI